MDGMLFIMSAGAAAITDGFVVGAAVGHSRLSPGLCVGADAAEDAGTDGMSAMYVWHQYLHSASKS